MSYGNNSSNCSTPQSDPNGDFFREVFETRPSKVAAVIFSATVGFILLMLVYGITWYEHFGSDKKRTLINKLASSLCWTWFGWFILIQFPDIVRYISVPLPHNFCSIQLAIKNALYAQTLLFLDGIIITRYIFIFWLKNPTVFQDDFWSLFINIWVLGFVTICQIVFSRIPGRRTLYYYICSGQNPLADQHIPLKNDIVAQLVTGGTVLIHIIIFTKIKIYKQKIKVTGFNIVNSQPLKKKWNDYISLETDSMTDATTSICSVLTLSVSILMVFKANKVPLQEFNCFPNYLFEYFFRMVWPNVLLSIFVLLHYYRNPKLKACIKKEFLNLVRDLKITFYELKKDYASWFEVIE